MRSAVRGGIDEWTSLRPRAAEGLSDPYHQVAAQVLLLERAIADAAARLGEGTVMEIPYERLCAEPNAVIREVRELMGSKGWAPPLRVGELPPFTPGPSRGMEEHAERLDAALAAVGADLAPASGGARA
jgi:hypothetical protein